MALLAVYLILCVEKFWQTITNEANGVENLANPLAGL